MSHIGKGYDINQTFVIESVNSEAPIFSACTGVYTNEIISCSGNTYIELGASVIRFIGDSSFTGAVSATTYYGDGSNLTGVSFQDVFVTGGTYNTNTGIATFTNNTGGTFTVSGFNTSTSNTFTGGTVTGQTIFTNGVTANTLSATTYLGLPLDIRVTGGSYNGTSGVATFTNNTGGTFTVNGFYTGYTLTVGEIVSVLGYVPLSAYTDTYVTGGTYSNGTAVFTNNTGGTFTLNGFSTATTFTGGTVTGGTQFTNGLTADTFSATTYLGLPLDIRVTGATYTNGTATFTNNSGGTFTVSGFGSNGVNGQIFYLNLSQVETPYSQFSPVPTNSGATSTGATIPSHSIALVAAFMTPAHVPNQALIPSGIWSFYLHCKNSAANNQMHIYADIYKRSTGGTETFLFQTDPELITETTPINVLTDGYFSGSSLNYDDRIVVKIYGINSGNQPGILTLYSEGGYLYSYGITPFNSSYFDIYTTGATLNNREITYTRNDGDIYSVDLTNLIATSITGGTYSNGTTTFINNTGGTFNISGYYTGSTDVYVTGGTYNPTNDSAIFTNNTGGTFTVSGFNTSTSNTFSGGTVSGATVFTNGLTANTLSTSTISATTYYNLPAIRTSIGVVLDGQGGVLSTGQKGYIKIPFNFTISGWSIISSISGNAVFDVWKLNSKLPTVSNTIITGGTKPSISANTYTSSSNVSGWVTSGATNDIIGWNVDSATTTTYAVLQLDIIRYL